MRSLASRVLLPDSDWRYCDDANHIVSMNNQSRKMHVSLVWNKGIAALCDRRIPDEFPDGATYSHVPSLAGMLFSSKLPDNLICDPERYADVSEGELVWVRLSWLKAFVRQVLPLIQNKFVLVTGDSDSCVPSEVGAFAEAIIDSPKVVHWYAQNYDGSVPRNKISPLPIGIDFHMLSERPIWGEQISPAWQQEQDLLSIREGLQPLHKRIPKVYVDFAWQRFHPLHHRLYHPLIGTDLHHGRWRLGRRMRKNPLAFCQPGMLGRSEMWRKRGEFAFVLSPHGNGLDCHRTWEALALNHIVLVPSSSLNDLYTGLPVVPLDSWDQVTSENLAIWMDRYSAGAVEPGKLTNEYWIDRMRSFPAALRFATA
jgi:hypothetical protein